MLSCSSSESCKHPGRGAGAATAPQGPTSGWGCLPNTVTTAKGEQGEQPAELCISGRGHQGMRNKEIFRTANKQSQTATKTNSSTQTNKQTIYMCIHIHIYIGIFIIPVLISISCAFDFSLRSSAIS